LGRFFEPEARVFVEDHLKDVCPWCDTHTGVRSRKLKERQADIYCYCKEVNSAFCRPVEDMGIYVIEQP
jgi:hypothetical protein